MPGKKEREKGESSGETFVRLANSRGSKAVAAIRNMGNLSHYEHTPAQTKKIMDTLARELNGLEGALTAPKGKRVESLFEL